MRDRSTTRLCEAFKRPVATGTHYEDFGGTAEIAFWLLRWGWEAVAVGPTAKDATTRRGWRRLEAIRLLGGAEVCDSVASSMKTAAQELRAERDENVCRLESARRSSARWPGPWRSLSDRRHWGRKGDRSPAQGREAACPLCGFVFRRPAAKSKRPLPAPSGPLRRPTSSPTRSP